jgi:hypothetical protein
MPRTLRKIQGQAEYSHLIHTTWPKLIYTAAESQQSKGLTGQLFATHCRLLQPVTRLPLLNLYLLAVPKVKRKYVCRAGTRVLGRYEKGEKK